MPIIRHADIRRQLLLNDSPTSMPTERFCITTSFLQDMMEAAPNQEERPAFGATPTCSSPFCKAYVSEPGPFDILHGHQRLQRLSLLLRVPVDGSSKYKITQIYRAAEQHPGPSTSFPAQTSIKKGLAC